MCYTVTMQKHMMEGALPFTAQAVPAFQSMGISTGAFLGVESGLYTTTRKASSFCEYFLLASQTETLRKRH